MAGEFDLVRPGDPISSGLINRILTKLQEHDQILSIITAGEGNVGPSVIDNFSPTTQQAVGQILTIFGRFDFPLTTNSVTVDNVVIPTSNFIPGSNDLQLMFVIPTSIVVPVGGTRPVQIRVKNTKGESRRTYLLLPQAQSSIPNPIITGITNFDNPAFGGLLETTRRARITGQNFVTPVANNVVKLRIQVGTSTITYPKTGGPSLAIDAANSTTTQLVVTIPDVTEISQGSTSPVTIEVNNGSPTPASASATVSRI
jgi:hypothetical protein